MERNASYSPQKNHINIKQHDTSSKFKYKNIGL